jgi:hypothetical protein
MSKNLSLRRSRQLQLRFEGDEVWTKLPPGTRQVCQMLLAQLLAAVVCQERELAKEANDHERQD